jgi:hypothetical protein
MYNQCSNRGRLQTNKLILQVFLQLHLLSSFHNSTVILAISFAIKYNPSSVYGLFRLPNLEIGRMVGVACQHGMLTPRYLARFVLNIVKYAVDLKVLVFF